MSFIAFKVSDYYHTAEREQYRAVCNLLRDKYANSDELCIFIANYNIFDCELDGIVIKSDALIVIEFKNYGGEITAVENGHWRTGDGTIIKGGSRKSVYQQAKLNHVAIKRGLKNGKILPNSMLADIPGLIVFAQPITLQNNLGERTKSWLHICDTDHFIDKVEDITSSKFYLTNEQIIELIPKLGLLDEFIDARFTVDVNITPVTDEPPIEEVEEVKSEGVIPSSSVGKPAEEERKEEEHEDEPTPKEDPIKDSYRDFLVSNVVPLLNIEGEHQLLLVHYKDYANVIGGKLPFDSDYVAILTCKGAPTHIDLLKRMLHKNVVALSDSVIVWPEGDVISSDVIISTPKPHFPKSPSTYNKQSRESDSASSQSFIKLPDWLDEVIFKQLGAKYKPSHDRYAYNLDLNVDESKVYLGTYFPRSFAETYSIFNHICNNRFILSSVLTKSVIRILDFGCGSGGATLGILQAIENAVTGSKEIQVTAIDGNHHSLRLFDKIIRKYNDWGHLHVTLNIAPCFVESEDDFNEIADILSSDFDFIITSKAIGEFERKKRISQNGYEFFSSLFAPLLSEDGLMVILDVTTKDEDSGLFLSQRMNYGVNQFLSKSGDRYKSIAPCDGLANGTPCDCKCFFKKEILVSHSEKSKDLTKFAVRIVTRQDTPLDSSIFETFLRNPDCINKI